jgi:hypothetical protein
MACHPQIISKLWPARFLIIPDKINKYGHLFLKGHELLFIIDPKLVNCDSGSKRACKNAEGLSSWMMDAMESATGTVYPKKQLGDKLSRYD